MCLLFWLQTLEVQVVYFSQDLLTTLHRNCGITTNTQEYLQIAALEWNTILKCICISSRSSSCSQVMAPYLCVTQAPQTASPSKNKPVHQAACITNQSQCEVWLYSDDGIMLIRIILDVCSNKRHPRMRVNQPVLTLTAGYSTTPNDLCMAMKTWN